MIYILATLHLISAPIQADLQKAFEINRFSVQNFINSDKSKGTESKPIRNAKLRIWVNKHGYRSNSSGTIEFYDETICDSTFAVGVYDFREINQPPPVITAAQCTTDLTDSSGRPTYKAKIDLGGSIVLAKEQLHLNKEIKEFIPWVWVDTNPSLASDDFVMVQAPYTTNLELKDIHFVLKSDKPDFFMATNLAANAYFVDEE